MGLCFWTVFMGLFVQHMFAQGTDVKVCIGTDNKLRTVGDPTHHYAFLKSRYTNCTYVDGNLELVGIEGMERDLSFVKDIREVTGYVLLALSDISYIPLDNLRIIRGKDLYYGNALSVQYNYNKNIKTLGLRELRFNSLAEILNGNVTFYNNPLLCNENTIDWEGDILAEGFHVVHDTEEKTRECPACQASCNDHCWGSREEDCQRFTRRRPDCSAQCDYRCQGPNPQDCCHKQCAVGCTGPLATDCLACLYFTNSGKCEEYCPPPFIYDNNLFQNVPNPDAKYTYGSMCVDECPTHLLQDRGSCVKSCPRGKTDDGNRVCKDCVGACPKKCRGFIKFEYPKAGSPIGYSALNVEIMENFTNCTIIDGSLVITRQTFEGDSYIGYAGMSPSMLSVLSTVEEITGYLQVEGKNDEFKNLNMFRNLKIIQGRELYNQYSLVIYQTSLESLGLTSLQQVNNGEVNIQKNFDLCFNVDDAVWRRILKDPVNQELQINRNGNRTCALLGRVCHDQCNSDGCWGFEANQCIKCANFELDGTCVESCEATTHYSDNKQCRPCHPQCDGMCNGPGSDNCTKCLNVKDGPFCKAVCPPMKYPDKNGECQPAPNSRYTMSTPLKVVLFLGSVREGRLGLRVAKFMLNQLKKKGYEVSFFDPVEMPFTLLHKPIFMYRDKAEIPAWLKTADEQIRAADAYVVVSAEYNHSIPPALSNMLDHFGGSAYAFKPSGIVTYSAGQYGGMQAAMQLRAMLGDLGMLSVSNIFGVPVAQKSLSEDGEPLNDHMERGADRLISQLDWYATALRNHRNAVGIPS